jgi:septal ring factor EnvC (AmiA/AmiB activator)
LEENLKPLSKFRTLIVSISFTLLRRGSIYMHDLNIVYEELKGDIIFFLKLYRSARAAGISVEHVVNLLRIANDDNNLPAVERKYEKLKQEVNALENKKLNSNKDLQDLKNQISTLRKTLGFCDLTHKEQIVKDS